MKQHACAALAAQSLYEALSSGELKSVKIGTRRLITIDAIKDWLRRNEQTSIS